LNERVEPFLAVQMLSALGMIGLILVQHGKGADMGAAFGSGGSGSLFGASGSANFLSRTTAVLAPCSLSAPGAGLFRQSAPAAGQRAGACCRTAPAPAASGAATQIPGRCVPGARAASSCGTGIRRAQIPDQIICALKFLLRVRRLGGFQGKLLGCSKAKTVARILMPSNNKNRRRGEIGRHAILRG
jgi:preprotein translocase subunit SecG